MDMTLNCLYKQRVRLRGPLLKQLEEPVERRGSSHPLQSSNAFNLKNEVRSWYLLRAPLVSAKN